VQVVLAGHRRDAYDGAADVLAPLERPDLGRELRRAHGMRSDTLQVRQHELEPDRQREHDPGGGEPPGAR